MKIHNKINPRSIYTSKYFEKATKTSHFEYIKWAMYLKKYPDPMLELGCYKGELVKELQLRKKETYGVDSSNYAIQNIICKDILQADAHFLPFKNNFFGTIFSFQFLEHLSVPDICLKDCYRILRSEGYFLAKWGWGQDITHLSDLRDGWIGKLKRYFKYIKYHQGLYVFQKVDK